MTAKLQKRQHPVKLPEERSSAEAAFDGVLSQIIRLNRRFTAAAGALTKPAGQTLARWLVLAECKNSPDTVAHVARRLYLARQSVQRIADVLERDGLCVYRDNPRHQRAKLLELTPDGRKTLAEIEAAQRQWSSALGERIGERALRQAQGALAPVVEVVDSAAASGEVRRPAGSLHGRG
jgi:DNA-binding MarR family transcriptional regulator